jgi:cytoskeletal protein RodZ
MAKKKRQKKQGSPLSFIFMAVFAYLAGFPIWIVFILGLLGFLLWQVQKAQQGSSKLPPLPPAENDESKAATTAESRPESRPEPRPEPARKVEQPQQAYREPPPTPTPPPWVESDYQPYPEPKPTVAAKPVEQPRRANSSSNIHGGAYRRRPRLHPLARNLQSRSGARQAIIAMTVLGPSRSQQPYEFDPIQQGDVAPPRNS